MRRGFQTLGTWLFRILFAAVAMLNGGMAIAAFRRGLYEGALCCGVCGVLAMWLLTFTVAADSDDLWD